MKTACRTLSGYHVIAKHSLGRHPIRFHAIVTAKVGKWEEFPSDTSVGGGFGAKTGFFQGSCVHLFGRTFLLLYWIKIPGILTDIFLQTLTRGS